MDNLNDQTATTAAPKPFSYEITPRAAHVGGGWRLQLFEGAFEVGGGIHPVTEEVTSDEAYQEALDDGEAWLMSRGAAPAASGDEPNNWPDSIRACGYTEVAPGRFEKPKAAPASADNPSTVGAVEPERMNITESKEYLIKFMEQNFTDKTFHRYIRGGLDRATLAGDFAWQMARALRLLAAPAAQAPAQVQWISVEDRLPDAENEDTGREVMVSDSLFIRGVAIDGGEAIGLGDYSPDPDVPDAGWRCYGGDYDFMHFAKVTHWMKPGRPAAPEQSALGEKGGE